MAESCLEPYAFYVLDLESSIHRYSPEQDPKGAIRYVLSRIRVLLICSNSRIHDLIAEVCCIDCFSCCNWREQAGMTLRRDVAKLLVEKLNNPMNSMTP